MDVMTQRIVDRLRDVSAVIQHEACLEAADKIEAYERRANERLNAEHYGPYGTACMNTGQFDAGECWICYAKRKKAKAGEMQLVAGRYQYQFEHAMKCINEIDDLFEYRYKLYNATELQAVVRMFLKKFTEAVKPKGK